MWYVIKRKWFIYNMVFKRASTAFLQAKSHQNWVIIKISLINPMKQYNIIHTVREKNLKISSVESMEPQLQNVDQIYIWKVIHDQYRN